MYIGTYLYRFWHQFCQIGAVLCVVPSPAVSLWNDLAHPRFDGVGLACFKSSSNAFLLAYATRSLFCLLLFPFLFSFFLWVDIVSMHGVYGLIGCQSLTSCLALLNINIIDFISLIDFSHMSYLMMSFTYSCI